MAATQQIGAGSFPIDQVRSEAEQKLVAGRFPLTRPAGYGQCGSTREKFLSLATFRKKKASFTPDELGESALEARWVRLLKPFNQRASAIAENRIPPNVFTGIQDNPTAPFERKAIGKLTWESPSR